MTAPTAPAPVAPPPLAAQLGALPGLVRFSHTVFALPFALAGALLAARLRGAPPWTTWVLVCVAMVCARTAAMAWNRLVDRRFDAANPRTAGRHLPRGLVTPAVAAAVTLAAAAGLVAAAFALNRLCGWLSPVALAITLGYSWTKRITAASHLVLGLGLACAPIGAWLAVTGAFAVPPLLLGSAVLLWVAGFDVIYATQDVAFDRGAGLHSLPARLGVAPALRLSAVLHAGTVAALVATGVAAGLGWPYFAGVGAAALLLAWEHALVRPDDLQRVNTAFFTANACVSALVLAAVGADWAMAR